MLVPFAVSRALIIRGPWICRILNGSKTWEMRSKPTGVRGPIGLIRQGSGTVVGFARLIDSLRPLDRETYGLAEEQHRIPAAMLDEVINNNWVYPWVLADVMPLRTPVAYDHPSGAVTFVTLNDTIQQRIIEQLGDFAEPAASEQPNRSIAASVPLPPAAKQQPSSQGSTAHLPSLIGSPATGLSDGVLIQLTRGNIQNKHFYLHQAKDLVPEAGIGGPNRTSAGTPFTVVFEPGETIETDVAGDKMIFRRRAPVGDFFARSGAKEGDRVRVARAGPRMLRVSLEPS